MSTIMQVIKRDGRHQSAQFDKITLRIQRLSKDLKVDPAAVAQQTIRAMCNNITTSALDRIAAECAESMSLVHPDYSILASRIAISNLHKSTPGTFSECCDLQRKHEWFMDESALSFVKDHAAQFDSMIVHDRDYNFNFGGFKTLQQGYLKTSEQPPWVYDNDEQDTAQRTRGDLIDRPQYMYMRMAIAKWYKTGDLAKIKADYDAMSNHLISHGTPAMMNACESGCLVSCYLTGCSDDTHGIGDFSKKLMLMSKSGGGVGGFFHDIRPAKSRIRTCRGISSGLCPQLVIYEQILKTFDQGGGKRKGSGAIYLEMWHADVAKVFIMKKASGGAFRGQGLFYAAWICDLFMKRLLSGQLWSLMGADTAPGLAHVYDGMEVCSKCRYCANSAYSKYIEPPTNEETCQHTWEEVDAFTELYTRYEKEGKARMRVTPLSLIKNINDVRRETGVPYICFKDHVNRQSNQKNIGTIQSSNLCTEIMQWSTPQSVATCILASVNLTKCVMMMDGKPAINYDAIAEATRVSVRDCDRMVDINNYPVDECVANSRDTRAIGVGCQGLANVFAICGIAWDSPKAEVIDLMIHETMYYAALCESADLAEQYGPYPLFEGSPASRGLLRFDLWVASRRRMGLTGADIVPPLSNRYDFDALKTRIQKTGLRNSLLLALMPTQSTSLIMGNNECFEPFYAMCLSRGVIGGERPEFNKYLAADCIARGIWTDELRKEIVDAGGITSQVASLPNDLKDIYKVWRDISQKYIIKRAAFRAAFIDQSQSLNLTFANNSDAVLQSSIIEAWNQCLPTGAYYARTAAATEALKTGTDTITKIAQGAHPGPTDPAPMCKLINGKPMEGCDVCSS